MCKNSLRLPTSECQVASSSVKACCDMIHDISLGEERERDMKFIDPCLQVIGFRCWTQTKRQACGVKRQACWDHHSLLAHFLALHADHADQMQGHEPQLSILITKTSTRAGNRPTKKEHMIEQQQNKHVLQLLPNCSLGSSTRCSCWSEHRALLPDSSICSVEHTDRQRCPFVKHTDRLRTSPQVQ